MADKNETNDQVGADEIADLKAQVEKLAAKNKELLGEKQAAKQRAQEAQDAADEAAQKAAEKGGDIEALKAAHAKELQKLQAKLDTTDSELRTIRVDNEIAKALTEGNVRPELAPAVTALVKSQVKYENGAASIEGVAIGEHVASFLGSDTGAHFRRASDNTGSGATGSTSTSPSYVGKEWSLDQYTALSKTDPAGAAAYAKANGHEYLTK
jgi:hypothetical protein